MYYSSGNYEAFATPKKPEGVDHKSAYLIGSGLAALTAACYLVRDGQMKGGHVHVFEKDPIPGGACDGYKYDVGYVPFPSLCRSAPERSFFPGNHHQHGNTPQRGTDHRAPGRCCFHCKRIPSQGFSHAGHVLPC